MQLQSLASAAGVAREFASLLPQQSPPQQQLLRRGRPTRRAPALLLDASPQSRLIQIACRATLTEACALATTRCVSSLSFSRLPSPGRCHTRRVLLFSDCHLHLSASHPSVLLRSSLRALLRARSSALARGAGATSTREAASPGSSTLKGALPHGKSQDDA